MRNKTSGFACALLALAIATWFSGTLQARDREFKAIVNRISSHYHKRPMRFMGFIAFVANHFNHEGVSYLKMAIFEDLDASRRPPDSDFDSFMRGVVGPEFYPFVRVRSNRDGEQAFIYARESGRNFELLIVSMEQTEAVVMKMRLDPEAMSNWVDGPVEKGRSEGHRAGHSPSR